MKADHDAISFYLNRTFSKLPMPFAAYLTATLKLAVLPSVTEPLPTIAAAQPQSRPVNHAWLWLNLASLDAPLVALLWQMLLQRSLHAPFHLAASATLAISVWFIYVSDRLLDALRWKSGEMAPRHLFYRRHWRSLATAAFAGLLLLSWLCTQIDPEMRRNGFLLLGAVIGYFLIVHLGPSTLRKFWPKEIVVGLIFSLGTCLPIWTLTPSAHTELLAPALLFAALCTLNCMAIEFWEWDRYESESNTAPHRITMWTGIRLAPATVSVALLSAACFAISPEPMLSFYVASFISAVGLFSLAWQANRMPVELLRVLADVVLFTPIFVLAISTIR